MTNWMTADWYRVLRPEFAHLALAGAAVVSGAVVGFERERMEKPAGLRTMTLVSLGAALFTMLSLHLAAPLGDRGRIAAQIVTGVGFLGAGAIMRGPLGVRGLTTAATVWVVAAIGTVIGAGFGTPGLALGLAVGLLLAGVARLERRLQGTCDFRVAELGFDRDGGKTLVRIEDILDAYQIPISARRVADLDPDRSQLRLSYCNVHRHHKEILTRLADVSGVREIRRESDSGA